ncbi:MAG: TolB family protein [Gaiellales bacterium]
MRLVMVLCATLLSVACSGDKEAGRVSTDERIAFGSSRDGDFEIYTMNPDGSGVRQLTRNEETDENEVRDDRPVWSRDGRWIAFMSSRDHGRGGVEQEELYVMRADGRDQNRLTENDTADLLTGWTDAGRIVFWACREGIAGCELRTIERDGGDEETVYETDDVVIASSGPHGGDVYARILSRETSTLRGGTLLAIDVENGDSRELDVDGIPSPDRGRLLIETDRDENGPCLFHDCEGHAPELYVDDRRLTETTGYEIHARWSTGGTRIVFARIGNDQGDDYELWIMNADGTCPTQLTDNGVWDWNPDWYGPPEGDQRLNC